MTDYLIASWILTSSFALVLMLLPLLVPWDNDAERLKPGHAGRIFAWTLITLWLLLYAIRHR